jgi:hypothetical protein
MSRVIIILFFMIVSMYSAGTGQDGYDSNTPVARVHDDVITAEEFRWRFEMTIWPGKHKKGYLNTIKQRFLYGMIAEKLLAMEAVEKGIEIEPMYQQQIGRLERMYARDALYRELVKQRIAESTLQIRQEIEQAYIISSNVITPADSIRIENTLLERLRMFEEYLLKHSYEIRDAEFIESLIDEYNLRVDAELFEMLTSAIEHMLEKQYGDALYTYEEVMFVRDEIEAVKDRMQDQLDRIFMETEKGQWSIEKFVDDMYSRKMELNDTPEMTLNRRVRNMVNGHIVDYLITQKAFDLELQKGKDVAEELERWRRHYIAESYKRNVTQDVHVDDFEIYDYYEDRRDYFRNPIEVNIREILVRTRTEAIEILHKLDEGRDFTGLAQRYSIRNWSARQGGEFGYFPSTSYGEIGRIAAMLEPGQRFGPMLIDEGYTIFELIDKRPAERAGAQELDEVEDSIEDILLGRKQREIINQKVKELAERYIVDIDYEVLHQLEVSSLQVLVVRYFGFGGMFPAVPMLDQILQWSEEWLIDHNLIL